LDYQKLYANRNGRREYANWGEKQATKIAAMFNGLIDGIGGHMGPAARTSGLNRNSETSTSGVMFHKQPLSGSGTVEGGLER
jgi:hypothetical protein